MSQLPSPNSSRGAFSASPFQKSKPRRAGEVDSFPIRLLGAKRHRSSPVAASRAAMFLPGVGVKITPFTTIGLH